MAYNQYQQRTVPLTYAQQQQLQLQMLQQQQHRQQYSTPCVAAAAPTATAPYMVPHYTVVQQQPYYYQQQQQQMPPRPATLHVSAAAHQYQQQQAAAPYATAVPVPAAAGGAYPTMGAYHAPTAPLLRSAAVGGGGGVAGAVVTNNAMMMSNGTINNNINNINATAVHIAATASSPIAPIDARWVSSVAKGCVDKDGTILAACVDDTQVKGFVQLPSALVASIASAATALSAAAGNKANGSATAATAAAAESEKQIRREAASAAASFTSAVRKALSAEINAYISQSKGGATDGTSSAPSEALKFAEPFISLASSVFTLNAAKLLQPPTTAHPPTASPTESHGSSPTAASAPLTLASISAAKKKNGGPNGTSGFIIPTITTTNATATSSAASGGAVVGKKKARSSDENSEVPATAAAASSSSSSSSSSSPHGHHAYSLALPASEILEGCDSATRNMYLRALLIGFEQLHDLHVVKRGPKSYKGFPGWDTAVVISYVHVMQNVAQSISSINEGIMGDIMRSWRKLFVFLQTCDMEVPNEVSRRRGALAVINSLLILLFQQDNTHQCRIILNTIEAAEKAAEGQKEKDGGGGRSILQSASHLVAEMVKFRYYQGRMRLYEKNFEGAFLSFSEASRLLPPMPTPSPIRSPTPAAAHAQHPPRAPPQEERGKKKGGGGGNGGSALAAAVGAADTDAFHPLAMGLAKGGTTAAEIARSVMNAAAALHAPIPNGMNAAQRDNKLRITFYQIASAILSGLRVPPSVLATDPVAAKVYRPIVAAIQNGSPAAFTTALDLHGSFLRMRGVYMLLQQARLFCYLTLFQHVHCEVGAAGKDNSMIPIALLVEGLAAANHACCDETSPAYLFSAEDTETEVQLAEGTNVPNAEVAALVKKMRVEIDAENETDDMILWVGRLIARGLVRGYVSYEHKMVVLSKKEPFPSPAQSF